MASFQKSLGCHGYLTNKGFSNEPYWPTEYMYNLTIQLVPEQFPQPGTPGGGGRPTGNEGILTLVPAGLTAVAVFPPFSSIRRTPAEAVIFKEAQGTLPGVNTG